MSEYTRDIEAQLKTEAWHIPAGYATAKWVMTRAADELATLRAAASEADALRATVAEQARQIETARDAIERCSAYIGSIDHGKNTKSYMMCAAWLAANTPTPAPEAEQELCKCGNPATEPHTCPYQADVNNDSNFMCTCCERCMQECADDI